MHAVGVYHAIHSYTHLNAMQETRPKEKWGLFGSFVMMAANIGTLLGNLVGALLRTLLTDEQLLDWGWRIPFWSGIIISFVAIYLRLHGDEHHPNEGQYQSEESDATEEHLPKHPLREAIRKENLMALISATLTPMLWGAGFYVSFVWMAIYMSELIDKPMESAFWINCIALTIGIIIPVPFGGWLSDKCGRVKIMVAGALGLGGLGPVLLYVISRGHPLSACLCQICLGWFLSLFGGPLGAWLGKLYTADVFKPVVPLEISRTIVHLKQERDFQAKSDSRVYLWVMISHIQRRRVSVP